MSFRYVSVEDAIARSGLRMVVGGVPNPWGEAAKGILHIKGIEWVAVRLAHDSEPMLQWAGQRSGPVAIYDQERPRSGWAETTAQQCWPCSTRCRSSSARCTPARGPRSRRATRRRTRRSIRSCSRIAT